MSNKPLEDAYAYAVELMRTNAVQQASQLPRYIRRKELRLVVPLADTTIYELEKNNDFPRRIVIAPRVVVWSLAEVEEWMQQRRRDTESGKAKTSSVSVAKRKYRPVRSP
jgi:prophage regulatory protein